MIRNLTFENKDASPEESRHSFDVAAEAIPVIMQWYGGFHAGDEYTVTVDGKEVYTDRNGELLGELP